MKNCRNWNWNLFFFCLRYAFTIFYIGSFQVPPKKSHPHLKCQFLPKIPIWPKTLLYERSKKWLRPPPVSLPPPHHPGETMIVYLLHPSCFCEIWAPCVPWIALWQCLFWPSLLRASLNLAGNEAWVDPGTLYSSQWCVSVFSTLYY